jgi:hypothetical protein
LDQCFLSFPRLLTVLHWQQGLALPWLRLELSGHSEVAHLALDNDGTLVAQLDSIHVRFRPVRKSVLKQSATGRSFFGARAVSKVKRDRDVGPIPGVLEH